MYKICSFSRNKYKERNFKQFIYKDSFYYDGRSLKNKSNIATVQTLIKIISFFYT